MMYHAFGEMTALAPRSTQELCASQMANSCGTSRLAASRDRQPAQSMLPQMQVPARKLMTQVDDDRERSAIAPHESLRRNCAWPYARPASNAPRNQTTDLQLSVSAGQSGAVTRAPDHALAISRRQFAMSVPLLSVWSEGRQRFVNRTITRTRVAALVDADHDRDLQIARNLAQSLCLAVPARQRYLVAAWRKRVCLIVVPVRLPERHQARRGGGRTKVGGMVEGLG